MDLTNVLVIRFSSFGDVTQALSIPTKIKEKYPHTKLHFLVRKDLACLLEGHPQIDKIWSFDRSLGLIGLLVLIKNIAQFKFSHVYDAHNNLRSNLTTLCLFIFGIFNRNPICILTRPTFRFKRLLLFKFRINHFEQPFSGQRDLLAPLQKWGVPLGLPPTPQLFLTNDEILASEQFLKRNDFYCLAPSAAYPLKRWPIEKWKQLIRTFDKSFFVLLGGPQDSFLQELEQIAPDRILNLSGKLNLRQSACMVYRSQALISNDTGLMHIAEQLGKNCVALMGPAPFGFPSRLTTIILQKNLKCRPCSKHGQGPCTNKNYQECLSSISETEVVSALNNMKG